MFTLIDRRGNSTDLLAHPEGVLLKADFTVIVPALCMARVPHEMLLRMELDLKGVRPCWIVREPGAMLDRSLLVDQGPVREGELWTEVFNLSNSRIRIEKGEAISRVVLW